MLGKKSNPETIRREAIQEEAREDISPRERTIMGAETGVYSPEHYQSQSGEFRLMAEKNKERAEMLRSREATGYRREGAIVTHLPGASYKGGTMVAEKDFEVHGSGMMIYEGKSLDMIVPKGAVIEYSEEFDASFDFNPACRGRIVEILVSPEVHRVQLDKMASDLEERAKAQDENALFCEKKANNPETDKIFKRSFAIWRKLSKSAYPNIILQDDRILHKNGHKLFRVNWEKATAEKESIVLEQRYKKIEGDMRGEIDNISEILIEAGFTISDRE